MNIKNTMCRLSELSQWEIDSLVDNMPNGEYFDFYIGELFIGFDFDGDAGTCVNIDKGVVVTYKEMMQLLGKTMQFTKSHLKTGMFVKYRNGDYRVLLESTLTGKYHASLNEFSNDLKSLDAQYKHLDIMSVFKIKHPDSISSYLVGKSLELIWERTEQTPAQKEMEVLQAQAKALQEQITKLQGTL
jgi:hypothetical protein